LLPSEAELSSEFSVSRVTVRKALEMLRDEGLVDSRQGFDHRRSDEGKWNDT
jgi:GntR family transcriptional regulator